MCTKGEVGGCSFCIERLSMNLIDITQKQIQSWGRKQKRTSHSFPLSWRYIKCCTRKTVYEKVFFFSVILCCEEVRSIHLTNLHSLCEQVARSSTPSAKQKLNQLKLFFQKEKAISHNFKRMESEECVFLICLKLGIYIM